MNKRLAILFLPFLLVLALLPSPPESVRAFAISRAECVINADTLVISHEHDADLRLPIASTTKILTALIVIEDCNLSDSVIIPKEGAGIEGSSVYLKEGESYTVEELLYGLMLRSGNDCAVTLALYHSGSLVQFAQAMNERAAMLGARNSHFTNPHGLPDEMHYSTARDLALITARAISNETFRTVASTKFYSPRGWKNKNKMLTEYEGAIGVKTGYTLKAGRCLVSAATRNGVTYVCVVLNSPDMFERSKELLDDAFENYSEHA